MKSCSKCGARHLSGAVCLRKNKATQGTVVGGKLVAKPWQLLTQAVEEGAAFGLNRTIKYCAVAHVTAWLDKNRDTIEDQIVQEILNAVSERFKVEGEEE